MNAFIKSWLITFAIYAWAVGAGMVSSYYMRQGKK